MSDHDKSGLKEVPKAPVSQLVKADFRLQTARGVGRAVASMPYSDVDLVTHLGNALKIFDNDVRRAKRLPGSLINWLMPRDLDNVDLDGQVVLQACGLAGLPSPDNVKPGSRYKVPALAVRCLLEAIAERAS
ncbi:MAG: hypothetical protein HKP56_20300 [Anderseniella sp.]|nr:hypothetical protein [Anderseniella sp.]